jgi:hypothetical protein
MPLSCGGPAASRHETRQKCRCAGGHSAIVIPENGATRANLFPSRASGDHGQSRAVTQFSNAVVTYPVSTGAGGYHLIVTH